MTIDSIYVPEEYDIDENQTYPFEFEHIGAESIYIYELNDENTPTLVPFQRYDTLLTDNGPIYDGGTIQFVIPHNINTVKVRITRSTPKTQLVDYQAYGSFPAETHEFALDKLTLIQQEDTTDSSTGGPIGGSGDYVARSGDVMTGVLNMFNTGLYTSDENGGFQTGLRADGSGFFSNSLDIWNFEDTYAFGASIFSTALVDQGSAADGTLIIETAATQPLTGDTMVFVGDIRLSVTPPEGPGNENNFVFRNDGQLILPQDPTSAMSATTRQWVLANAGGGTGGPIFTTEVVADNKFIAEQTGVDIEANGWEYSSWGDFHPDDGENGYNGGVIQPHISDRTARMRLSTIRWDPAADGGNGVSTRHDFWFDQHGSFGAPGDIIIDSDATAIGETNKGSLEIRNYEPDTGAGTGWFGLFASNNFAPGSWQENDDATLYIQSSKDNSSGSQYYKGSVVIGTYQESITSGNPYDPEQNNQWRFQTTGDFVAPGNINLDGAGANNNAALQIRNYETTQGVDDSWYAMYVVNASGVNTLNIVPAYEDADKNATYYNGAVVISTNGQTTPSEVGNNNFIFGDNGYLTVPSTLVMDNSTIGATASLEMRAPQSGVYAGNEWYSISVVNDGTDGLFVIEPYRAGAGYVGAIKLVTNDIQGGGGDSEFKFTKGGNLDLPGDLLFNNGSITNNDVFATILVVEGEDAAQLKSGSVALTCNGVDSVISTSHPLTVAGNVTVAAPIPTLDDHLTRKDYVDGLIQGLQEQIAAL